MAPQPTSSLIGEALHLLFWRTLCQLLSIKANLSMAYHPETDSQTEWVNQILEQYLWVYINYQQDDWVNLLPLAEFVYNDTSHSETMVTPFFTNKGFHLKLKVSLESVVSDTSHQVATNLKELHLYLCDQVSHALKQYEIHSTSQCLLIPPFKVGDTVWLDLRNIRTTCPSKKLDHCFLGPFLIVEKVLSHAFQIGLSLALSHIHPVFHVSLLQPTSPSEIPNRTIDLPPPIKLDDSDKWEVHQILDSRVDHHRKGSGLLYLDKWKGFENTPDATSWEPPKHLTNAPDVVQAFHQAYPDKPAP